jgi:hypothetical protein
MKGDSRLLSQSIKEYKSNTGRCRRDVLFEDTDNYTHIDLGKQCLCCDVCVVLVKVNIIHLYSYSLSSTNNFFKSIHHPLM